ncbi:MAG: hypothetical protein ACLQBJ_18320 [Bryobacteraceae bacterium]
MEACEIAGHATVRMAEEYSVVRIERQEEFTQRIQDKLFRAGERAAGRKLVQINSREAAA